MPSGNTHWLAAIDDDDSRQGQKRSQLNTQIAANLPEVGQLRRVRCARRCGFPESSPLFRAAPPAFPASWLYPVALVSPVDGVGVGCGVAAD